MKKRYERNFNLVTEEEFKIIQKLKVAIIGLGGLGGNITEMIVRFGFKNIILVDYDVFDETNLNRQILSSEANVGKSKADEALKRVKTINSEVNTIIYKEKMTYELGKKIIKGCDLVFDALDNVETRLQLSKVCDEYNIPLIHGAIDGWYGQVSVVTNHSKVIEHIYTDDKGKSSGLGNPSFTPAIIAGIQVSEGIKYILKKGGYLENKVLFIDLLHHMYEIIEI